PRGIANAAGAGLAFRAILGNSICRSLIANEPCLPAGPENESAKDRCRRHRPHQKRPRRPFAEFSQLGGSGASLYFGLSPPFGHWPTLRASSDRQLLPYPTHRRPPNFGWRTRTRSSI